MLQVLAVTCSVLQFVPECCGMLQCAAVFECVAVTCGVLQCAAGWLQCATACCYVCRVGCSDLKRVVVCIAVGFSVSPCGAMCCNAVQFVSVCCIVLQCVAECVAVCCRVCCRVF